MGEKITISTEEYRILLIRSVKLSIIEGHASRNTYISDTLVRDALGIEEPNQEPKEEE